MTTRRVGRTKCARKEFKLEALRMMDESDRPANEIAMQLGVRRNQLYKWKEQLKKKGEVASAKKGRPKKEDQPPTDPGQENITRRLTGQLRPKTLN